MNGTGGSGRKAGDPGKPTAGVLAATALLAATFAWGFASSTTTTTHPPGTTTTTLFVPVDVSGGGDFEGSFPAGSFDTYVFELDEPRVLVAETTNGFGGCPGDTIIELRHPGAPSNCGGMYGDDLPCIAFDDDSGIKLCSRLVKYIAPPGSYEIRVSAYAGGKLNRYFLHVDLVRIECGNGVVELTENCDDGNMTSGDCCSSDCHFEAAGSPCNDGLVCNGDDTCDAAGVCSGHSGMSGCPGPDGDDDCQESCSDEAGGCTGPDPNGSPCNDGLFCNGTDTCLAGSCSVHSGDPCPGADGDADCSEVCDEAADACSAPDPNGSSCNDALFCNGADTCLGGACAVHTGNPCPGPDGDGNCVESCNELADSCTAPDSDGSACNDGVFCNGADFCMSGACSVHAGSPCPGADGDGDCSETCDELAGSCTALDPDGSACNDGLFCNGADTCVNGGCTQHGGSPCPGPDGDDNCSESCSDVLDGCVGPDPNGSPCNDGVFCNGADSCSNGACSVHAGNPCAGSDGDGDCAESCNEAADSCSAADPGGSACNDGVFCNGADTCAGGTCSVHAGNPCPGPDSDGNCAETCNEAADNCSASDPDGSACNDGLFCNGADSCSGGACSVHAGSPCPGADGDGNCSETCSEAADSCSAPDLDGSACNDDLFCDGADTCSGGACSVHAGSPCPGPDGDSNCAESCSEATDTCNANDTNGSACNDGLFCNGADTCASGACSVHAGNPCPGADGDGNCAESCSEAADACTAPDPNGSVCDDGLACNGADTCNAGVCDGHAGDPCPGPDGDADCAESCSDSSGGCTNADPAGSPCDDGIFCNGADACSGGACSVHAGSPCPGPDGDGNCAESCNEATDSCSAADLDGSPCDDGVFCNGADTCSNGTCSVHAGSPCPGSDGDNDCAESCSEAAHACTAPDANGSTCNDGLFCDGADTCSNGACSVHAGNPCPGPDSDSNCVESCNEDANSCTAPDPDGASCTDSVFCNGADKCSGGVCSVHAGNPCPGADGDGDCVESCSEVSDKCTGPDPDGSACDDGVFCNGADQCSQGLCSVHAGNPCTGPDGDGNCSESCDEAAHTCTGADPDGSSCSDGLACDGADTCQGGSCSAHAIETCPGADGDSDCAESCGDSAEGCGNFDPNGSPCDDGIFCNGRDFCAGGSCSIHAGDPCFGGDGDGNCAESCDEAAKACSAPDPSGSPCRDADPCTPVSTCNGSGGCVGGASLDCNDNDPCTTDACSETVDCTHTPIAGCPVPTVVCGDVSGDGLVKASDALNVLKAAVGGPQCTGKTCVCDANDSGKITAADALLVLKFAVGSPVVMACPC